MKAVSSDLPEDPAAAAIALVQMIHGDDEAMARAATGELLRRAGLPIVSIDGPVVAIPDVLILGDAPVYAELIDGLTWATRQHNFYTPSELAELLAGIGFSEEPLPQDALLEALGQWGKADEASDESVVAAAAVRALAAQRGQVLFAGADPLDVQIDPLQTLLILAHISSRNWVNQLGAESPTTWDSLLGVEVAHAQGGLCGDLARWLESEWDGIKPPPGFEWLHEFNKSTTKKLITDILKEAVESRYGELGRLAVEGFGKTMFAFDALNAVMSTFLLMQGLQIEIEANPKKLHFHHEGEGHGGSHSRLEATATFNLPLSQAEIACYSLLGVKIPNGVEGYKIRWQIHQPRGRRVGVPLLAPISAHLFKTQYGGGFAAGAGGGEILGSSGRSVFEVYTATETASRVGVELSARATIVAQLDKNELPFKLSDLLGLLSPLGSGVKKSLQIAIQAFQRAGLPSARATLTVEWHGPDIYLAYGDRNIFAIYADVPLEVILWTCEGLEGEWHTVTRYRVERGLLDPIWRIAIPTVFNIPWEVPEGYTDVQLETFRVTHQQSVLQLFSPFRLTGHMSINKVPEPGVHVEGVIGEVEVRLSGLSFAAHPLLGGSPFTLPIEGVSELDVCPGGDYSMGVE